MATGYRPRHLPASVDEDAPLQFQVISYYVPETDMNHPNRKGFGEAADLYEIMMFGVTAEGYSVCAKVTKFEPYFYVRVSDTFGQGDLATLKDELMKGTQTLTSRAGRPYTSRIIDPTRFAGHLSKLRLCRRIPFYGFTNGETSNFLKVKVKSMGLFYALRRYFEFTKKLPLYESNLDSVLRFIHTQNIQSNGWVTLAPSYFELLGTGFTGEGSRCQINVEVPFDAVKPLQKAMIAPLLIASFDIECTSSHGDFPQARKSYLKLAQELSQLPMHPMHAIGLGKVDYMIGAVNSAFDSALQMRGNPEYPTISKVFPLNLESATPNTERLGALFEKIQASVFKIGDLTEEELKRALDNGAEMPVPPVSKANVANAADADESGSDSDDDETNDKTQKLSAREKEYRIQLFDLVLTAVLPKLKGDAIIQIGTTVQRFGSDEIVFKHMVTLDTCDPIENVELESFSKRQEAKLLLAWTKMILKLDPDILIGYNIFGFDMRYMYTRASELGIEKAFVELGRVQGRAPPLIEKRISSSALGDNIMHTLDIEGRICIDLLKVVQRDHKLDSYKLDNVASIFMGQNKHDLSPQEIFKFQELGPAERCTIANYCIQDCALVSHLLVKLKIIENNSGMANVCFVPLGHIFDRGQGIKIFSLTAKAAAARGYVLPVLKSSSSFGSKNNDFSAPDDEVGYEGAVVLEPKEGIYLNEPISVMDFASLYPSVMMANNLSHDSYVLESKYANLPGVTYEEIKFDVTDAKGQKEEKCCLFAQPKSGAEEDRAIVPQILHGLLTARKNTRKLIEYKSFGSVKGLVVKTDAEAGTVTLFDVVTSEKVTVTCQVSDLVDTYNDFEKAVFDALQLAYKVTANSLYGQVGARTSQIYCKEIAACTTAGGRAMIMKAKAFVEKKYKAEVIYGDSVMPYTPITLLHNNQIKILTIEEIANTADLATDGCSYPEFKAFDDDKSNSNRREKQQLMVDAHVWTSRGWSKIHRLIRHKCRKTIYRVLTQTGLVDVTEDHSLLDSEGRLVKPKDLKKDQNIELMHEAPVWFVEQGKSLMTDLNWIRDFEVKEGTLIASSHWQAQLYVALLSNMNYFFKLSLKDANGDTIQIDYSDRPFENETAILAVEVLHESYDGLVYDIETEEGQFLAGVGNLIVKNTDSIFCKFPCQEFEGTEKLQKSIEFGQQCAREIKTILKAPHSLEYEKSFSPFILLSKKRYAGNMYTNSALAKPKEKSMGIVLKRRDNAPIVKRVYGGIIDIILNQQDVLKAADFLQNLLAELVAGRIPLEELIISKTLRGFYKTPESIAHRVLADRMGKRDGNKPNVNDRIPYVYIKTPVKAKLQGDRIEHPDFIRQFNLHPDYAFYITNQIMKPVCQLFALALDVLPGGDMWPALHFNNIEDSLKAQGRDQKWIADKLSDVKAQAVQELLFRKFIEMDENGQGGSQDGGEGSKVKAKRLPKYLQNAAASAFAASASGSGSAIVPKVKRARSASVASVASVASTTSVETEILSTSITPTGKSTHFKMCFKIDLSDMSFSSLVMCKSLRYGFKCTVAKKLSAPGLALYGLSKSLERLQREVPHLEKLDILHVGNATLGDLIMGKPIKAAKTSQRDIESITGILAKWRAEMATISPKAVTGF